MQIKDIGLIAAYAVTLVGLSYPLGSWLARLAGTDSLGRLGVLERALYRISGVDADRKMGWRAYALAVIVFNALGALAVYALERVQGALPLNPAAMTGVEAGLAFNTAVSFVTNTNWQAYAGESTMSYLTQMLALTVQNFLSAASAIAVAFALMRAFARRGSSTLGNFWVDMTRGVLYLLLPLSAVFAGYLIAAGSIQNLDGYVTVHTLDASHYDKPRLDAAGQVQLDDKGNPLTDPAVSTTQVIAMGPVASQEAIKMIGTNGGGFFNANSAHPFENPTPLSNFLQMVAIFLIPAALCFAFGHIVGDQRQGWAVFAAMTVLFVVMAAIVLGAELVANPQLTALGMDATQGNMEGKELRFGSFSSALFGAITTAASCGAVNGMHDSFMPLGGFVPLFLMELGEVVFGGVGSGLYGMLVYAILAVFIAGLMIGRTPEYLGKKIEAFDMKMASLAILVVPLFVLLPTAIAVSVDAGTSAVGNPGAHGFSEILYAYSSAANNNGSAFAGLSANTPFYNVSTAIAMWFGRFGIIVPVLALAGSLAAKKRIEVSSGTLPTHGPLFVILLISTVILVGALTYVPALALGPVVEHLKLFAPR